MSLLTVFPSKIQASGIMQPIQTSPVNLYNNNNNSNNKLFPFPPQQPPQQPQQKSMDPFGSLLWKMWNFTKFFSHFFKNAAPSLHTTFYFCFSLYCFSHHFCYFMFFILLHPQLWKRWVYFFDLSIFKVYLFFYWVSKVKMYHFLNQYAW